MGLTAALGGSVLTDHSASAAPPGPPAGRSGRRHGLAWCWEQQQRMQEAREGQLTALKRRSLADERFVAMSAHV